MLLTKTVINYGAGDITSFVFFLLSRMWIILLWTVFTFFLSQHPDSVVVEEDGSPKQEMKNQPYHHLSKLIKYEVLSSKFHVTVFSMVTVFGLLDLAAALASEFSTNIGGYPNLFTLRCVATTSAVRGHIGSVQGVSHQEAARDRQRLILRL